ncbi:stonustoxin subunit alpha-like [Cyprinodon tularosa]|uniref:stonustoxin subunit alpha-like n=1 Tax=Cyprinodon tularosa TaxID=77115 RepID=UPI0018E23FAC|nr:stonustoxin subunit alpha-like [Cyprinodon tularosa]
MEAESSRAVEVAALGRPFGLGMLYDCRRDLLIPGITLWNNDDLLKNVNERQQNYNNFEINTSETDEKKYSVLDVGGSLKLSYSAGMFDVGGSGNYLKDNKTSRNQARVTLQYLANTKVRELSINNLGENIMLTEVVEQGLATHVVTAILYGAQAFFVFDREVSKDENIEAIQGEFKLAIKEISNVNVDGEASLTKNDINRKTENKFSCKFYGDFILQKTPLTFQEAIQLYQTLPNLLGANGEQAVPLKVWMLPLTILNPSAARMVKQISVGLVQETQRILDDLSLLEVRCNDAIRATADKFPKNGQNLKRFKEMGSYLKVMLQQDLAMKLPLIRGGECEEDELEKIFRKRQSSPFSNQRLNQWMDWKEKEICFLKALMSTMKSTKHLPSPNQLYEEVLRTEEVLCFVFTSVEDDEPFVSALENYLKGTKLDCSADKEREQWLDSKEEVDDMKKKAKLFSDYAEANKERKNMKFLTVALTDDKHKGKCSTIYRYKQGIIETEDYEIPSPNQ